jgi:hypothetical protein
MNPFDPRAGTQAASAEDSSAGDAIPMLTDVVQLPRYSGSELPAQLNEVDWTALALRVRENVMERLLRRSDMMLDAQLQSTLKVVIERTTETLSLELHDVLSRMIRDLVSKAVSDELTRVHTEMARRASDAQLARASDPKHSRASDALRTPPPVSNP